MNSKFAIKIMLALIGAVLLFHVLIILKIIPYEITWGGRLKNDKEMYVFEFFSISINLLLITLISIKGKIIKQLLPYKLVNVLLWIFFGLFALNTIGNIFAETILEKSFTILTLASCYLLWIILKRK